MRFATAVAQPWSATSIGASNSWPVLSVHVLSKIPDICVRGHLGFDGGYDAVRPYAKSRRKARGAAAQTRLIVFQWGLRHGLRTFINCGLSRET
jgi:hypothetical protein